MSTIYNIGLFDSNDNCVNWFESYNNIITGRFVEPVSSKFFFHLDHAKNCVDQFIKTSTTNKSKTHDNKLEEFKERFPNSTFKIIETEVENLYHIIEINVDGKIIYLKSIDKNTSEISYANDIEDAYQYTDYENLKEDCKFGFLQKFFTKSQVKVSFIF